MNRATWPACSYSQRRVAQAPTSESCVPARALPPIMPDRIHSLGVQRPRACPRSSPYARPWGSLLDRVQLSRPDVRRRNSLGCRHPGNRKSCLAAQRSPIRAFRAIVHTRKRTPSSALLVILAGALGTHWHRSLLVLRILKAPAWSPKIPMRSPVESRPLREGSEVGPKKLQRVDVRQFLFEPLYRVEVLQ